MSYEGQAPHGGVKITHHELCFEDCGHWDCMGCCYCPEESDVATVEALTATKDQEWLAIWFSDQIAAAEQAGRARAYAEHIGDCGNSAYLAGVKAARDAVAALPAYYAIEECQGNPLEKGDPEDPDPWKQGHLIERDDALAAIDALKEES